MKKIKRIPHDRILRKCKYLSMLIFVLLMPMFLVDLLGQGAPYFCKWICPAGTLEGGIFLVLRNEALRSTIGWLYTWKLAVLLVTVLLAIKIYRPFCKYICPLGAIYSIFNPVSVLRYRVDAEKCISCGVCAAACDMGCDPTVNANSLECIRCGKCKHVCPTHAIRS